MSAVGNLRVGALVLPTTPWHRQRDHWRLAEELGFHHAWTFDHLAWAGMPGEPWGAAVPTLTAAACATDRIRLGTLVSSPNFREPVTFAAELATLDEISGGRVQVGLGAGVNGTDSTALGHPARSGAERMAHLERFVHALDALLSGRGGLSLPSAQHPRLPFAISGAGPRGLDLAVGFADTWVTNGFSARPGVEAPAASPAVVADQLARLDEVCARHGRDPKSLRRLLLYVNRGESALSGVDTFLTELRSYAEAGITDVVFPFPDRNSPFRVAAELPREVARLVGLSPE
ncbi:LLM class flavin-dependent oxidoreductase [Actinosynnema sp. NPDC020468]|uniref:LLM class flavin-dependent oxidoreductase n=1 Tax=Actinosynnema sp. NPDC020468 TaxID=3154488 RepID=UPI0033C5572C